MKYYIAFDTKDMPGKIKAISVEIKEEIVGDLNATFPINLVEDPFYERLEQYVKMNKIVGGKSG